MKKAFIWIALLMLILPALPLGAVANDFQGGQKEAVLALVAPSFEAGINLTIPAEDHILNSSMNVTGMPATGNSSAYPEDVVISLNDNIIWAFNGTGYGPLGRQDLFSDGSKTAQLRFGSGGGTREVRMRLPKGATVQSAVMDVKAFPPKHWEELLNFTVVPEVGYPSAFACAGDVNGDGYDDIIIGSAGDDTNGTDAGRAYLYYGRSKMNGTPDVVFNATAPGDRLGWAVSGAGDLNGDGYDDIVMGAIYNDSGGDNAGRAYIFFGGQNMDTIADVNLTGEAACDFFGISVSGAGDVNCDGYDDVLIGSCDNDAGDINAGRAYIYFGGPNMNNVSDVVFTGGPTDGLGATVSGAGDVNGDGYDDVIVGAPGTEAPYENTGRAYVFFGGQQMDNVADVTFNGTGLWDQFAVCVCGAGDLNGDGYDDVAVGADDYPSSYAGRVEVFFGGRQMNNKPDIVIRGASTLDSLGWSVSGIGDVNGDGYDDLMTEAEGNDVGATNAGRAYIFYGGRSMDNISDLAFNGTISDQRFGRPVSGAGDVNRDLYDEILIGGNWGGVFLYSQVDDPTPSLLDPSISIGTSALWKKTGYFNGTGTTGDFAQTLNDYIRSTPASGNDSFGNYYVDVLICASAESAGDLSLRNLKVVYDYNATVPNFAEALNKYVAAHQIDKDAAGNISAPINVRSESAGRVKLFGLNLTPDRPPVQVWEPGTVEMDEDTVNSTLIDLYSVFEDDSDSDNALNFSLVPTTNSSPVMVTIGNDRYLSADALTGEANDNWTGSIEIVVACKDTRGLAGYSKPFTILIRNVNDPPIITSSPILIAEPGMTYSYGVIAADGDRDALEYTLAKAPANMTIDPDNGTIRWQPSAKGIYQVNLVVDDGNATDEQKFTVEVPNRPARISSTPPLNATTGVHYVYNITAEDPNMDVLTFSVLQGPEGMDIQPGTGRITWIPAATGNFDISMGVWDGSDEAFHNFTVKVAQGNRPPEIIKVSGPNDERVKSSSTLKFSVVATDIDGDNLTYDWQENGSSLGTGPTLLRKFPSGQHTLMLLIGDGQHQTTRTFNFTVDPAPASTEPGPGLVRVDNPVIFGAAIGAAVALGLALTASTEVGKYRLLVLFLPLYTRLHKEDVLDHGTREFIRGSVYADPGIHYNEILRRLKLARGTATYHLNTLEREGFIRSHSDGRLRRFYPAEMKLGDVPPRLDKVQKIILETVRESEGLGQREIARILGLPSSTVNRHIIKLTEMGILKLIRQGMTTRCYLANGNVGNGQETDKPEFT
jgi:DNA-binding MarR family transcriptional regulator